MLITYLTRVFFGAVGFLATMCIVCFGMFVIILSMFAFFIKWVLGIPIKVNVTKGKEKYVVYYRWFTRIR